METGVISTEGMSSMITDSIMMIDVECQPLPRGVDHRCLDSRMTDVLIAVGGEFQSTPGNQALMRDPFSFKVWSTGIELTEKATTKMRLPVAEYMFQGRSVSVEPSEPL